jgi:hypothetical protein
MGLLAPKIREDLKSRISVNFLEPHVKKIPHV